MSNKRVVYQALVEKILDHTNEVREIFFKITNGLELHFQAGQFVMLHVPQENSKPALRAYSIASGNQKKIAFDLIFKVVPGGVASTYIWNLQEGDPVEFTGPFGRLFFPEPPSQQIIFLNTGSGIAQHLSYLRTFADQYPHLEYHMYFGLQNEKLIYYEKELQLLQKKMTNFQFHYVISNPSPAWTGRTGYVQHFLKELDFKNKDTSFFLCGNGNMIKDTKKILIEEEKFDISKIHCEAFH